MSRLKAFLLVLFLVPITFQAAPAQKAVPTPASPSSDKKQDFAREPYVIETEEDAYRFENDGNFTHMHHERVRIQSEAAVRQMGVLVFGYSSANEKVEIQGAVEKKDGTKVPITDENIQDMTSEVARIAPVYSDFRQKHVTVPGMAAGDVLDVTTVTRTTSPLIPGHFWAEERFDRSAIVLHEVVTMDVPADRKVKIKWAPEAKPEISEAGGRRTYRWTSSYLESRMQEDGEDYDSEAAKARRKAERKRREAPAEIQLTTFQSWEELGEWFGKLEAERSQPTPEIQAKAAALTKDLKTDRDKARALYDYVSPSVRYISISFGLGRFQPHDATEVMHNEYGDCKDKHTLYASLLRAVGIDAEPVLINSQRKIDPDIPSPAQFDHVFTALPTLGGESYADTTPEVSPFGLILLPLRDKKALLVSSNPPPHLITTPVDGRVPQTQDIAVNGTITPLGKFEGAMEAKVGGTQEVVFRMIFRRLPSDRWRTAMGLFISRIRMGGEVKNVEPSEAGDLEKPFALKLTFEHPNALDWTKHESTLRPMLITMGLPMSDPESDEAMDTGGTGDLRSSFRVELPAGYKATAPIPIHLKRDYMEYESKYSVDGQVLTGERELKIFMAKIPTDRFSDWEAFRRAVQSDEEQDFAITHEGNNDAAIPQDSKADELFESGNNAFRERQYKLAIQLLSRVVELEPKHKSAWNTLGQAYLADRQPDAAVKAFKQQTTINAYDEYAYNNLGRAYWMQRDYANAEAAFRKQIEINPLDKWAHANLGNMLRGEKKFTAAVPELETAVQIDPKDAFARVALGDAYLNTGQTEKAQEAFDRGANLAPGPSMWNDIAYYLSLKKVNLDRAEQYAVSAIDSLESSLRNTTLDSLQNADLRNVESLANTWDTLGWVYFQKGDLAKAEKYVAAAWNVAQHGEEGDHLGQIYALQGKKAEAIRMYKMSLHTIPRSDDAKDHLASLTDAKTVERELGMTTNQLEQLRTTTLKTKAAEAGTAEFFLLVGANGRVEEVKFVSGKDKLKLLGDELKQLQLPAFPDNNPYHLIRRGAANCTAAGTCTFVLYTPESVTSKD